MCAIIGYVFMAPGSLLLSGKMSIPWPISAIGVSSFWIYEFLLALAVLTFAARTVIRFVTNETAPSIIPFERRPVRTAFITLAFGTLAVFMIPASVSYHTFRSYLWPSFKSSSNRLVRAEGNGKIDSDHGKLAIVRDGALYVMDVATRTETRLDSAGPGEAIVNPAFSSDGAYLVYTKTPKDGRGKRGDLWLAGANGTEQLLARDMEFSHWNKDGRWVYCFTRNRTDGERQLWKVWVATSDIQIRGIPRPSLDVRFIVPSPDEQSRAYVKKNFWLQRDELWVESYNGERQRLLASAPVITDLAWSPGSHRIAFVTRERMSRQLTDAGLYLVDLEDRVVSPVATARTEIMGPGELAALISKPIWSPNGRYVAVNCSLGAQRVFIYDTLRDELRVLPRPPDYAWQQLRDLLERGPEGLEKPTTDMEPAGYSFLSWTPDGRGFLVRPESLSGILNRYTLIISVEGSDPVPYARLAGAAAWSSR